MAKPSNLVSKLQGVVGPKAQDRSGACLVWNSKSWCMILSCLLGFSRHASLLKPWACE